MKPQQRIFLATLVALNSAISLFAATKPSFEEFWFPALSNRPPLDLQVVGKSETQGVPMQRILYSASTWQGKPQRVFALYAHPEGQGPFPAVLQIHGGGQTCYPENVAYFVKRGFACLSFDWTGPREGRANDSVTHWDNAILGNYFGTEGQDPHAVLMHHAALGGVGGVDVLASRPEVDPQRIGVQGISWGGFLTWLVNGLDPRLKAAVPVYGIGDQDQQWNDMGKALSSRSADYRALWRSLFDPVSFARFQHGAVLYVDAANDFFGPLDIAERRLASLLVDHRRSYGPNRMHGIDEGCAKAGVAWLDSHLKLPPAKFPPEPDMLFDTSETGEFVVSTKPDTCQPVRSVRFDFSRGDQLPLLRCWLSAEAKPQPEGLWRAAIPLVDPTQKVSVMAQIFYDSGMMLSTPVQEFRPAVKLPKRPRGVSVPSDLLVDPADPVWDLYVMTGTDFTHADPFPGKLSSGEIEGRKAFIYEPREKGSSVRLATRRIVDPGTLPGAAARIEIYAHDVNRLRIRLNNFLREPGAKAYEAAVTPGAGWQRVALSRSDFSPFDEEKERVVDDSAQKLSDWNEIHQLEFICEPCPNGRIALGQVKWLR